MKRYVIAIMLGVLASFIMFPMAQSVAQNTKDAADYPVLEKLRGDDDALVYDYLGTRYGLDVWLLTGPQLMQVVYVLPQDKSALIGGTLVSAEGKEASSDLLREFLQMQPERAASILQQVQIPEDMLDQDKIVSPTQNHAQNDVQKRATKTANSTAQETPPLSTSDASPPDASPPDASMSDTSMSGQFWRALTALDGVVFGDDESAPVVFAVLDPLQPETKIVWKILEPLAQHNHLRLHVVPLAVTSADSIMDVTSVLGNKDPAHAWRDLMEGRISDTITTPESYGVLRMQAIVDLAQKTNLRQLPLLVYRAGAQQEKPGAVRIVRGLPKDWVTLFRDLGMGETELDNAP